MPTQDADVTISSSLIRKVAPSLCALLGAVAIAGCGGSGGGSGPTISAGAYASAACTAMKPILADVKSADKTLSSATSATSIKADLVKYLNTVGNDWGVAAAKLKAAGTPNVTNGAKLASSIVVGLIKLGGTLHNLAGQANALATTNVNALTAAATNLERESLAAMANVNNLTSGPEESKALASAVKNSAACKAIA